MSLSAAKSRLFWAKSNIESNRLDEVESLIEQAEGFLRPLPDDEKAALLAEMEAIRTKYAETPKPADDRNLSSARGKIQQAQMWLDRRMMTEDYEVPLGAAEGFLAQIAAVHAALKAPLLARIAEIRASLPTAAPAPAAVAPAPAPVAAVAPAPAPIPAPVAVAATPVPTPAAPPAASGDAQALSEAANQAIRQGERDLMFESSFDPEKYGPKQTAAQAALAQLQATAPTHGELADLTQRFDAMAQKADKLILGAFTHSIDGPQRSTTRALNTFEGDRKDGRMPAAGWVANELAKQVDKVRPIVDAARGSLTSAAGREAIAAADAWLANTAAKILELRVIHEAFGLFETKVTEAEGTRSMNLSTALESVELNLGEDAERVIKAWDIAKKLIARFENPRFTGIPEIDTVRERYRTLEARVAAELRPMMAKRRTAALLDSGAYWLNLLKRDTDALDEVHVLQWRKGLREAIAPLQRDWADVPDVQDFLAKCARAFAHSEEELGPQLVLQEIQEAEVYVKPLVERVERGLELASATRVLDHAPRLRARRGALAPLLGEQRAKLLDDRAGAALARIESVFGAQVAREVEEAEAVPRFAIDLAADAAAQGVLGELNAVFERFRETYAKTQEDFEERVDLDGAGAKPDVWSNVESAAADLIRAARSTEPLADKLRKIDRTHEALAVIETVVPKLVKRTQAWKQRLGAKIEYASVLADATWRFQQIAEKDAGIDDSWSDARDVWPAVLDDLRDQDPLIALAVKFLPDDHDEADALAAKVAALRAEAAEKLPPACLAAATSLAREGSSDAQSYADALANALPDAPENAMIAAVIAGTADAHQKAHAEIQARAELIRKRAEAAAQEARPSYDEWASDKEQLTALAGTIVQNIDKYRGKWVAANARHLGLFLYDEPSTLNGDIYQFDYDPDVRAQLAAGMKKLDDLYAAMVEHVTASHAIANISTRTQHYPRDAYYLCEIVGVASYTPQRQLRDASGRNVGTIDGDPYPVPRVVIRGISSAYFVIVPGQAPSHEAMDVAGIAD